MTKIAYQDSERLSALLGIRLIRILKATIWPTSVYIPVLTNNDHTMSAFEFFEGHIDTVTNTSICQSLTVVFSTEQTTKAASILRELGLANVSLLHITSSESDDITCINFRISAIYDYHEERGSWWYGFEAWIASSAFSFWNTSALINQYMIMVTAISSQQTLTRLLPHQDDNHQTWNNRWIWPGSSFRLRVHCIPRFSASLDDKPARRIHSLKTSSDSECKMGVLVLWYVSSLTLCKQTLFLIASFHD